MNPPPFQTGSGGRVPGSPLEGVRVVRTLLIPASPRADIVVPRCAASSRSRRITVSSILRVIFIWKTIEWLDSFYARDIIVSPHLKSAYRIRRNNIIYTVCTVKELMRLQSSE